MTSLNRPVAALVAALSPFAVDADGFTRQFPISDCEFKPTGGNEYLKLSRVASSTSATSAASTTASATSSRSSGSRCCPRPAPSPSTDGGKSITVRARVMEEYETADGEVEEISRNYVADLQPDARRVLLRRGRGGRRRQPAAGRLAGRPQRRPAGHPDAGPRIPARLALLPGDRAQREGPRRAHVAWASKSRSRPARSGTAWRSPRPRRSSRARSPSRLTARASGWCATRTSSCPAVYADAESPAGDD